MDLACTGLEHFVIRILFRMTTNQNKVHTICIVTTFHMALGLRGPKNFLFLFWLMNKLQILIVLHTVWLGFWWVPKRTVRRKCQNFLLLGLKFSRLYGWVGEYRQNSVARGIWRKEMCVCGKRGRTNNEGGNHNVLFYFNFLKCWEKK